MVSKNALYLEGAVCFYSLKNHEEAALGVGINVTKDLRCVCVCVIKGVTKSID